MRQIVLDTETTGLEPADGHRIIEIGCVELINRRVTGNTYHQYIQPEREIDPGAIEVHGITNESLVDKPRFADIAEEILLRQSKLRPNDIDVWYELAEVAGKAGIDFETVTCTPETLAQAESVFLTNALGLRLVSECNGNKYDSDAVPFEITAAINGLLKQA